MNPQENWRPQRDSNPCFSLERASRYVRLLRKLRAPTWVANIALLVLLGGVALSARSTVVNLFAEYFDQELPSAPCQTFDGPQAFTVGDLPRLLYRCTDGRDILRTFTPASPVPVVESVDRLVTCPSAHRACGCLPAGSYAWRWLETVGCGR